MTPPPVNEDNNHDYKTATNMENLLTSGQKQKIEQFNQQVKERRLPDSWISGTTNDRRGLTLHHTTRPDPADLQVESVRQRLPLHDAVFENLVFGPVLSLSNCRMDGGLFKNVTADAVRIENCTFNNCTFEDLNWEHCDLIQCDFINCTFRSVNLKRADLRGSLFEDISIPNKPRQHWSNVCLFDANANTTRFKHITLEACSLQYLRVDAETILEFYPQGDANNFDGIPLNVPRITSHSYELLRSAQIRQSRLTSLSNATAISEKAAAVFFILIFGLDGSIRSSVYTLILTVFSMTLLAYFCNKHFDGLEMSGELERLPEEFQNCLYFVITTMSTTGYGDVKPKANDAIGITLSIVIMCAGYLLSGTVLARLLNRVDR